MTSLAARPDPVEIGLDQSALVVVDMQNAFASKGGMLDLAGHDISAAAAVVKVNKKLIDAAREAGVKIVYLQVGYKPDLSDAGGPSLSDQRTVRRDRDVEATLNCVGEDLLDVRTHERLTAQGIEDLDAPVRGLIDDALNLLQAQLRRVVASGAHCAGQIAAQGHIETDPIRGCE